MTSVIDTLLTKVCYGVNKSKASLLISSADNVFRMQLVNTWVSIAILRQRLDCQLPIELFYDGDSEMPPSFRKLFQVSPGTRCFQPPGNAFRYCSDLLI